LAGDVAAGLGRARHLFGTGRPGRGSLSKGVIVRRYSVLPAAQSGTLCWIGKRWVRGILLMRWPRWILVSVVELLSAAFAAAVGIVSNVLTNEEHPRRALIIAILVFVILSAILQIALRILDAKQATASTKAIKVIKDTTEQIRDHQLETDRERRERRLDETLALFPPIFRAWIKSQWDHEPAGIERVLSDLSDLETTPAVVMRQWQQHRPDWFNSLGWRARLIVGELAHAYNVPELSADLFLAAVEAGSTRAQYWTSRVALSMTTRGEAQRAAQLLQDRGIHSDSQDQFSRIVSSLVADDREATRRLLDAWVPEAPVDILLTGSIRVILIFADADPGTGPTPSQLSQAVSVYRGLIKEVPDSAAAPTSLAGLLISYVDSGASLSRHADLEEALRQALRGRDLCRAMRSSSVQAVELACQAAYLDMSATRVIEIGTAGTGEATIEEANSDIVRTLVASAALASSQFEISDRLIPEIEDSFHKPLLVAMSAEVKGNPSADLWRSALQQARNVRERGQALLGLARTGATELPGIEEVRSESPNEAAFIQAVSAAVSGDVDSAIRRLRALPGADFNAVAGLASAYLQVGNVVAATGVLREGARVLSEPRLRLEAGRLLWQFEKKGEAIAELEGLLVEAGSDASIRHDCLGLLGQWAAEQEDWITAQARFQELLALDPRDEQARWNLVLILLRRGLTSRARQVYENAPQPPAITRRDHARAWMAVRADAPRTDPVQLVEDVIDVAQRFPDEESVQSEAIFTILSPGEEKEGPLPPITQGRFNELCERFFSKWPNSSRLRRISAEDAQTLLSQMAELIRPTQEEQTLRAQIADQLARNVLPWAFLSVVTGRSYSEIVVVRGGGVLPARSIDAVEQQMCREAAQAALDRNIVLDISAAAVVVELPQLADVLMGMFESLSVTEGERLDATRACDFLRGRGTSTWVYDEQNDRGRIAEITQEMATQRYDKATQLLGLLDRCRVSPVSTTSRLAGLGDLAASSWATAVECAAQTSSAFWCDDVALRALARSIGVPAFSTPALLEVLVDRGILTSDQYEDAVWVLIEGLVGDFPVIAARLSALVAKTRGVPGPVASVFSRSASWINVQSAYQTWCQLVRQAVAEDSKYAADWLYAAVIGIARPQRDAKLRREASALLLSFIVMLVADKPDEVVRCVVAVRAGLAAVRPESDDDDDPLGRAAHMLCLSMSQIVTLPDATSFVSRAFNALASGDRDTVLRALYT
jgi:tetratricopeptide (TPR) repeat protein